MSLRAQAPTGRSGRSARGSRSSSRQQQQQQYYLQQQQQQQAAQWVAPAHYVDASGEGYASWTGGAGPASSSSAAGGAGQPSLLFKPPSSPGMDARARRLAELRAKFDRERLADLRAKFSWGGAAAAGAAAVPAQAGREASPGLAAAGMGRGYAGGWGASPAPRRGGERGGERGGGGGTAAGRAEQREADRAERLERLRGARAAAGDGADGDWIR